MSGHDRTGSQGRRPGRGVSFGFLGPYGLLGAGPIVHGVGRGGIPYGCGRGRCFGGGRGLWRVAAWGCGQVWPAAVPHPRATAPQDELDYLRREEASLRQALDEIKLRIEELETEGGAS